MRIQKLMGPILMAVLFAGTLATAEDRYAEKGVVDAGVGARVFVTTVGARTQTNLTMESRIGFFPAGGLRLGLDSAYQYSNDGNRGQSAFALLALINKYFDTETRFYPYIGGGAGMAINEEGAFPAFFGEAGVGFQVGLGGFISIGPQVQLIPARGLLVSIVGVSVGYLIFF